VDVTVGDPVLGTPDELIGDDVLGFAGIAPPRVTLYAVETHIAEKLHAYTMPRAHLNLSVKDLPDIALLATVGRVQAAGLRAALDQTFRYRGTHPVPSELTKPPSFWERPYATLAREDALAWPTLVQVHTAAVAFLDPVLSEPGPEATMGPGNVALVAMNRESPCDMDHGTVAPR
jgi:catechol 2,3-dioxygenase-like lactoylglutathione lyase family enzyme